MRDTQDIFIVRSLRASKNVTECNSLFVYWPFDRLVKLNELKGKFRVPEHLLKGKKTCNVL